MTVKVVTFFSTLMQRAHEVGQAKLSGDPERLAKAEAAHEEYKKLCLDADEMRVDIPVGWGNPRGR